MNMLSVYILFNINYLPVSVLAIVNMIFEKQNNNDVRLLSNNKKGYHFCR